MKRKSVFLTVLAVVLVLCAAIGPAQAYFTTYATAKGGYIIKAAPTITEPKVSEWTKHVVVSNSAGGTPVFVRASAFSGSLYPLTISGEGWTEGENGFWYYNIPLEAGQDSTELLVRIGNIPENAKEGVDFNVTVVYESVLAVYDSIGNPDFDASWVGGEVTVMGGNV